MYVIPICSRETNDGRSLIKTSDQNKGIAGELGFDADCLAIHLPDRRKIEMGRYLPLSLAKHGKLPKIK